MRKPCLRHDGSVIGQVVASGEVQVGGRLPEPVSEIVPDKHLPREHHRDSVQIFRCDIFLHSQRRIPAHEQSEIVRDREPQGVVPGYIDIPHDQAEVEKSFIQALHYVCGISAHRVESHSGILPADFRHYIRKDAHSTGFPGADIDVAAHILGAAHHFVPGTADKAHYLLGTLAQ